MSMSPSTAPEPEGPLARLVYSGEVLDGQRLEDVRRRIGALYKLDEDKLARLFSGQRVVFMRGVDLARAQRHVQRFARLGGRLRVELMEPTAKPATPVPAPAIAVPAPVARDALRQDAERTRPGVLDSGSQAYRDTERGPLGPDSRPRAAWHEAAARAGSGERRARERHAATASPPRDRQPKPATSRVANTAKDRHPHKHTHSHKQARGSGLGTAAWLGLLGAAFVSLLVGAIWLGLNSDRASAWAADGMHLNRGPAPAVAPGASGESDARRASSLPSLNSLPSDEARAAFANEFAPAAPHKAFAVSPSGAWAWKSGYGANEAATQRAIAECNLKRTPYTPPCEVINLDGQWIALASREP